MSNMSRWGDGGVEYVKATGAGSAGDPHIPVIATEPAAGSPFTDASTTVGTSSASVLAADSARKTVTFHNPHATATITIHLTSGTAVLNGAGTVTLNPGDTLNLDGPGATGAFTAIASAAATPITIVTT